MILPKKMLIAFESVLFVACNGGAKPVPSKDICKNCDVSMRYIEQLLQELVRDGILKSVRGPKGGYMLAKERRKLKLAEICECALKVSGNSNENIVISKAVSEFQNIIENDLIASLKNKTLEELYESYSAGNKKNQDFAI